MEIFNINEKIKKNSRRWDEQLEEQNIIATKQEEIYIGKIVT